MPSSKAVKNEWILYWRKTKKITVASIFIYLFFSHESRVGEEPGECGTSQVLEGGGEVDAGRLTRLWVVHIKQVKVGRVGSIQEEQMVVNLAWKSHTGEWWSETLGKERKSSKTQYDETRGCSVTIVPHRGNWWDELVCQVIGQWRSWHHAQTRRHLKMIRETEWRKTVSK